MRTGSPLPDDPVRWRVLVDGTSRGATNMARDHALALELDDDRGVVRFYDWERPTVSFGRNEPVRGHYDLERIEGRGWDVVRRPSGGRAVLHDRELTYAVVSRIRAVGGPRRLYAAVHRGLVRGLRALGVAAERVSPERRSPRPDAGLCFARPAPGEVAVGGGKLVGSAQVRVGSALLQHGSVLLWSDQRDLADVRLRDGPAVGFATTLEDALGAVPDRFALIRHLREGLESELGGAWREGSWRPGEVRAAEELEDHYRDPAWTYRR